MYTYKLEFISGEQKGLTKTFDELPINIGLNDINNCKLNNITNISDYHAMIVIFNGKPALFNHSIYGTMINKTSIDKVFLKPEYNIQFGNESPIIRFSIIKNKNSLSSSKSPEKYNKSPILSKINSIIDNAKPSSNKEAIELIIDILNKENHSEIFNDNNDDIEQTLKELSYSESKLISILKFLNPELQTQLALQLISFYDALTIDNIDHIDEYHLQGLKQKCIKCNNEILPNSIFCISCGHNIINEKAIYNLKTCPNCKNKLNNKNSICLNCGFDYKETDKKINQLRQEKITNNIEKPVISNSDTNLIECPCCFKKIPPDQKVCPYCQGQLFIDPSIKPRKLKKNTKKTGKPSGNQKQLTYPLEMAYMIDLLTIPGIGSILAGAWSVGYFNLFLYLPIFLINFSIIFLIPPCPMVNMFKIGAVIFEIVIRLILAHGIKKFYRNIEQYSMSFEICRQWNWGAFILPFVWGLGNKLIFKGLISIVLFFIPGINYFWALHMGKRGNQWAWESYSSNDVDAFNTKQKWWTAAMFILSILINVGIIVISIILGLSSAMSNIDSLMVK